MDEPHSNCRGVLGAERDEERGRVANPLDIEGPTVSVGGETWGRAKGQSEPAGATGGFHTPPEGMYMPPTKPGDKGELPEG